MACSSPPDGSPDTSEPEIEESVPVMNLAGSEWNMGEGSEAFVAFKGDGSVIGNGGCNGFRGTYTQDGATVSIGPLATTRKLCPPDIMTTESALLSALGSTASVDASHLNLSLIDDKGVTILKLRRSDWD